MDTKQFFDAVPKEIIDQCILDYNSRLDYDTATMNKTPPGDSLSKLQEICESYLGRKLLYRSGNFYKHTKPYLPHTDYKTYQDNTVNFVIPLEFKGTLPSLVVFDQLWELDSVTWCMHHAVQKFETNTGVKGCPYEYPVSGLTNKIINEDLYKKYLYHFPKETLFGLSGNAYPFEPRSLIVFDNKKIHCTSSFLGEKLGISLRFSLCE